MRTRRIQRYEGKRNNAADLVRRPSGDEHGVSQELHDGPALDAVLFVEPAAQHLVQVPALVVDGVVVRRILLSLLLSHLSQKQWQRVLQLGLKIPAES